MLGSIHLYLHGFAVQTGVLKNGLTVRLTHVTHVTTPPPTRPLVFVIHIGRLFDLRLWL